MRCGLLPPPALGLHQGPAAQWAPWGRETQASAAAPVSSTPGSPRRLLLMHVHCAHSEQRGPLCVLAYFGQDLRDVINEKWDERKTRGDERSGNEARKAYSVNLRGLDRCEVAQVSCKGHGKSSPSPATPWRRPVRSEQTGRHPGGQAHASLKTPGGSGLQIRWTPQ